MNFKEFLNEDNTMEILKKYYSDEVRKVTFLTTKTIDLYVYKKIDKLTKMMNTGIKTSVTINKGDTGYLAGGENSFMWTVFFQTKDGWVKVSTEYLEAQGIKMGFTDIVK